jgi:hypothetical protein
MDRDCYAKLGTRMVEKSCMASSLVVHVETSAQKCGYNLLRF